MQARKKGDVVTYYPKTNDHSVHHRAVVVKVNKTTVGIKYDTAEGPFRKNVKPDTLADQLEIA